MGTDVRFDTKAIGEILRSEETMALILSEAQKRVPGEGYGAHAFIGEVRANARITAYSQRADQDNLDNNTLLRAISQ